MTSVAQKPNYDNSVPFPCAGEGALLRFRTVDLIALEQAYGDEWLKIIADKLNELSPSMMVACLKAGLKKKDGKEPWGEIDFNDMPFSPYQSREQIMDAIAVAISGKSYATVLDEKQKAKDAGEAIAEAFVDPLKGLEGSSVEYSGPDTDADSLRIAS